MQELVFLPGGGIEWQDGPDPAPFPAGVEIDTVTTNTSKSLQNWPPSKWLKREHWPFTPVLADDAKLRAFFGYGGQAFPYFVLVGKDGKVVARAAGELDPAAIAAGAAHLAKGEPVFTKS